MAIKGINTGPIVQNGRLFLTAFKALDDNNHERFFIMQMTTLIDFLILLRTSAIRAGQHIDTLGDEYKNRCIAVNESLALNIPEIKPAEVNQPNPAFLVTSIAPKMGQDGFRLIACMHDESILTLDIDDLQADFIMFGVRKAIEFIKDEETLKMLNTFMSFMMLYDVNLSDISNFKYNELKHEPWKQHFFAYYMAVIYCFETEEGKQLLAGNVLKINLQPDSPEVDNLLQLIATYSPVCKALQEKYKICETFTHVIDTPQGKTLTKDECLRALHTFCLEKQKSLAQ